MSVWLNEQLGGEFPLATPAYLPQHARNRLESIRQARMLYRGQHWKYFLQDQRTRYDFPDRKINGGVMVKPYVQMNLLRLITRKTVDLIVGEAPLIKIERSAGVPDAGLTKTWDEVGSQSMIHLLLVDAMTAMSWAGVAYLEAVRFGGKVYLRRHPSGNIVPEGELQPDGQYPVYARHSEVQVDKDTRLVLSERWSAGQISREVRPLLKDGLLGEALELARWPGYAAGVAGGEVPEAVEKTGLATNTLTAIFNDSGEDDDGNIIAGVSDYDGLVGLQDTVNHKFTGMVRVIDDNIDPTLVLPSEAADSAGRSRVRFKTVFVEQGEVPPQYLVYNAPLEAAVMDRNEVINTMLIIAEMSPALLGIKSDAAMDSARKMRLAASPAIAKGKRTASRAKPGVERAVAVALSLAAGTPTLIAGVSVEFRDGLPVDDGEQADTISTLRSSGVMSREAALEQRYGGDRVAIDQELKRLASEDQANRAQIVLGELTSPPANEPGEADPAAAADEATEGGVA